MGGLRVVLFLPATPPPPPDQSDHRGTNGNLQSGKSDRAIFGTHTFGSQTPPPLLLILSRGVGGFDPFFGHFPEPPRGGGALFLGIGWWRIGNGDQEGPVLAVVPAEDAFACGLAWPEQDPPPPGPVVSPQALHVPSSLLTPTGGHPTPPTTRGGDPLRRRRSTFTRKYQPAYSFSFSGAHGVCVCIGGVGRPRCRVHRHSLTVPLQPPSVALQPPSVALQVPSNSVPEYRAGDWTARLFFFLIKKPARLGQNNNGIPVPPNQGPHLIQNPHPTPIPAPPDPPLSRTVFVVAGLCRSPHPHPHQHRGGFARAGGGGGRGVI